MNNSINLLLQQAIKSFEHGNLAQTKILLNSILKIQPKNFHALHIMGVTLGIENKHEEACNFLLKAIKINPNDSHINFNLAKALSENGDDLESLKYHKAAIKISPNYAEAWLNFGKSFYKLHRYDEALSCYTKASDLRADYAEAWINKGITLHDLKHFDDALSCYNQAILLKPDFAEAWSSKGITLHHIKNYHEAISCYDQAILLKPDFAEAWANKGITLHDLKHFDEALSCYDQAIHLKPDFAEAWSDKGVTLNEGFRQYDEALFCYDQAIHLNPNYAEAWSNKGVVFHNLKLYDQAISLYNQSINLKPDYAKAWNNKGVTLHNLKSYQDAISHFNQAIHLNPNYNVSYWNKSLALLSLGDFENGWNLYCYRWERNNTDKYRHAKFRELYSLENLINKNILIWHEQGYGDTIQFSRYIEKLTQLGAKVTFEVPKSLLKLFEQNKNLTVTSNIKSDSKFDFQAPLLLLPKLFQTTIDTIPNPTSIQIKPEEILKWRRRLNLSEKKPNIGLAISGNPNHGNDSNRSMTLKDISPILNFGKFFLIQKEIDKKDFESLRSYDDLIFLGDQINDFTDTASIISNMDLIISVDTSLIHLAGSLNKNSYLMVPWCPEWRWLLDRSDSPWYPSIKIFRQKSLSDWNSVIEDIKNELSSLTQ